MADDMMFQDAVEALRRGDKARARDLLTRLLKEDQKNATYWVWMSGAVDSEKERIYCLQTAFKLDPENVTAKRGLILHGALSPEKTVQPFQMNRPRAWEEKLLLAHELPKPAGMKALTSNPAARLAGLGLLGVLVCAAVVVGFMLPRRQAFIPADTNTPGPSPTFSATPTFINATGQPTPTFSGPTPLWMFLPATYTPTPLYVSTPRAPQAGDQFILAKKAYEAGDWDAFIQNMIIIATLEPESADVYYYIGEGYRFQGNAKDAVSNYNRAIELDEAFGAPYLGLARVRLRQEPNANVEFLFDEALARDPNFGEVYLERARYFLRHDDPQAALSDLDRADELMPGSPEVYLTYANAYLALEDTDKALTAAEKANELDRTSLPSYLLLGELYVDDGQYEKAIEALETYVTYEPEDSTAFALIGQSYFEMGEYESALEFLDKAYDLNPTGLRRYRLYRGLANLELGNADEAVDDLERAFGVDEKSFAVNLGLARAYYMQEKFGSAFLKIEGLASLAETDEEVALVHYWRALIQEKREQTEDAVREWNALLEMDEDAMTPEMRATAQQHLRALSLPTNTPKPPTRTPTPSVSKTKTPIVKQTGTVTPTRTPTP
jgi:tetratricopeptide (TPR) repeat protein